MTRQRGELPEPEEQLLGIERQSPEEEAAAEKKAREERELVRLYLVERMRETIFRDWLMKWLVHFGTFNNTFAASQLGFPDPQYTFFRLGMKAAGWDLWEEIDNISPELASLMRREHSGKA